MITALAKPEKTERLSKYDAFLKDMYKHYDVATRSQDPSLAGLYNKAKTNLLSSVGGLLVAASKEDDVVKSFPRIEAKFVLKLMVEGLSPQEQKRLPCMIYEEAKTALEAELEEDDKKSGRFLQ